MGSARPFSRCSQRGVDARVPSCGESPELSSLSVLQVAAVLRPSAPQPPSPLLLRWPTQSLQELRTAVRGAPSSRQAGDASGGGQGRWTWKVMISPRPLRARLPCPRSRSRPPAAASCAASSEARSLDGGQCCSSLAAVFTVSPKSRKRGSLSPTMPATSTPQCRPMRSSTPRLLAVDMDDSPNSARPGTFKPPPCEPTKRPVAAT
mmetsp:Transcript_78350/g.253791  ORF Transcript_78350/g.253791 Transcript_78350/m.253791 type:complete len:206 (-) Transcript_78350:348-965(-)